MVDRFNPTNFNPFNKYPEEEKIISKKEIIEQLPEGVSLDDFWKCVKLQEIKNGINPSAKYKSSDLLDKQSLEKSLYTDKVIKQTIENLPSLLEEIKIQYKGGNVNLEKAS